MKYKIHNYKSNSKQSLEDHARRILYKGDLNSFLELNDFLYMMEYFRTFHYEWQFKKGCGLRTIQRVKEPRYGKYRAFWLYREDGSSTDISYRLSNIQKKDYRREFQAAMREVIKPQISAFRSLAFQKSDLIVCPITGDKVEFETCHVDHHEPLFHQIINDFIRDYKIKLVPELFPQARDGQVKYEINDQSIAGDFYHYHQKTAKLRITSASGNLRRKK